jgi:hypothetical protein
MVNTSFTDVGLKIYLVTSYFFFYSEQWFAPPQTPQLEEHLL